LENEDRSGSVKPLDYLSHPVLEGFFSAREHEAYYASLKSADERREFHDRLVLSLVRFLAIVDERIEPVIDEILARSFREKRPWLFEGDHPFDPVEEARTEEPEGIQLLGIAGALDFATLRIAYRAAALRHHPDRGGSNADMVAINRAYELLHSGLGAHHLSGGISPLRTWTEGVPKTSDYVWSVTRLLFDVALDDWALDEAAHWLEQLAASVLASGTSETSGQLGPLEPAPLQTSALGPVVRYEFSYSRAAADDDRLIGLVEPSAKLAERLTACGAHRAAERALAVAEVGLRRWEARSGPCGCRGYGFYLCKARDVVAGERKARFVLNHLRQLENALRLGAIDDRRYVANSERISGHTLRNELNRLRRQELLAKTKFIQTLPIDPARAIGGARPELVPHPGWYESRIEELNSDQQAEYATAFGSARELLLVEKYAWVRLSSLLRSAIYFLSRVDAAELAAEVTVLARLQPRCAWYAEQSAGVLSVLSRLNDEAARELAEQLRLLLEPDEPEPQQHGRILVIVHPPAIRESTPGFFEEALKLCDRCE